jgi:hypothetical protein
MIGLLKGVRRKGMWLTAEEARVLERLLEHDQPEDDETAFVLIKFRRRCREHE